MLKVTKMPKVEKQINLHLNWAIWFPILW